MIKYVADIAKNSGVEVFMCGEMAGDPMNIPILLGLGISKLSMNPQSIPIIKKIIRSLDAKDAALFVEDVLKETSETGVMELLLGTYNNLLLESGYTDP
jgi:phosphotransferase system enzyme I (PtsI)